MKLLFDHNLSYKLVNKVLSFYPDSNHVKNFGLEREDDYVVRNFAKENGFVIVTQDSDFFELASLFGVPPKVLWVRTGNVSTNYIEHLLKDNVQLIHDFEKDEDKICLELL